LRTARGTRVTSRPISGRVRMLVRILPVRQFAVRSSQITKPRRRCSSHQYKSQLLVENRDFCPRRNIAITFDVEKLELLLPDGEKIGHA